MKIWRTIIIGTHDDKDKLLSALAKKGIQVTDSKHIWDSSNFRLSSSPKECKLVRISLDELGFTESALYKDVCKKAQEIGLKLAPAEVGPQLKMQYNQRLLTNIFVKCRLSKTQFV
jgi:hypothetical protein